MKRATLFFLLAFLWAAAPAAGQTIALGERAPELKVQAWLAEQRPADAPLTYIEFFHSSNKVSLSSIERLAELSARMGTGLRIVILAHEPQSRIGPLLAPYLSPQIGVGLDPTGKLFAAYGVNYVPFGVLLGPRNRVRWMGNTLQLTPEIIENSK